MSGPSARTRLGQSTGGEHGAMRKRQLAGIEHNRRGATHRARGKGVAKVLGKADARWVHSTRRGIRKNVLGSPLARFEAEWISTSTPTVPGG